MDTNEIKTLCLKHVYGAALTEAERKIFAQAWRLRQLLPQDERPAGASIA